MQIPGERGEGMVMAKIDNCISPVSVRATSHLCVKRERPLIITYSLCSEDMMQYNFYFKHVRGEE